MASANTNKHILTLPLSQTQTHSKKNIFLKLSPFQKTLLTFPGFLITNSIPPTFATLATLATFATFDSKPTKPVFRFRIKMDRTDFFRRILIKFRSDQKKVFWDHQKFLKSFGILSQLER